MNEVGLRLTGLRAGKVLHGVDLTVERGQLHALMGPNGAGKSTLLAAVLGEVEFTGTIERAAGAIGYVPQRFTADTALPWTVRDFLTLTLRATPACLGASNTTAQRVASMLEAVGLAQVAGHRLAALSGGELKRVLLAHALEPAPSLLLLDEPSAGMDSASVERLHALLKELKAKGCAILWVTHDEAGAKSLADKVTYLREGRVVA